MATGYGVDQVGEGDSRLARLSEGQVAALSLVAQYKSSKEIARILDISPHTVDQRMKRVQALLGVGSRFEAARLYSASRSADSSADGWDPLIYHAPDIPTDPASGKDAASVDDENLATDKIVLFRQGQAAYANGFIPWPNERPWYRILLEADKTNDWTVLKRVSWVFGVALIIVLTLGGAVSLAEGLSRIF